jgi:endonuclease YncB( thermonuclease family)
VGNTRLAVAVLALVACTPMSATETTTNQGARATVTWVYDGDTIEVEQDGRVFDVRLDGVNAPEQGECFHQEATSHLVAMVQGGEIDLVVTGEDQFDRVLAMVWDGEVWVNHDLVANGAAIATTDSDGDSSLIVAEEQAYEKAVGLWGACASGSEHPIDIHSIAYDPAGPDDEVLDAEAVVLVNHGDVPVDLDGWALRDESSRHRFRFDGVTIGPGERLTVTSADDGWDPGTTPVWNNDGDIALLLDSEGRIVARYRY